MVYLLQITNYVVKLMTFLIKLLQWVNPKTQINFTISLSLHSGLTGFILMIQLKTKTKTKTKTKKIILLFLKS